MDNIPKMQSDERHQPTAYSGQAHHMHPNDRQQQQQHESYHQTQNSYAHLNQQVPRPYEGVYNHPQQK